ncbi:MAG TPA: hypothetical protein DCE78_00525 [Bacteroidetes bacterium]|nr:hypothetical protein [Bacteroidota bacterium]
MRIIQICPYDLNRPGGVRSHIFGLSQSLVEAGHEVIIIGPDSSVFKGSDTKKSSTNAIERDREASKELIQSDIVNDHDILKTDHHPINTGDNSFGGKLKFIKIGYRRSAIPLWGTQIDFSVANSREKSSMLDFFQDWNPDVAHFHTPWTPFLSMQIYRLLKKLKNAGNRPPRFIATFHDSPPDTWFGSVLGNFVMPLAAKFMLPKFDEVISVSEFQSQFISKWSSKKVHIIPNGIRLDEGGERVSWEPSKTILFLGRLEARKGLIHLLQAYKILKTRIPEVNLIVAGEGPQRREGELFSQLHQLEVDFRGMVSEEEKNRLLLSAGVFVSPALFGESFGIVLVEAMAKGVPVAGYGNPGYLSVVAGVCEENFPSPGDVAALANVIDKVLTNPDYAQELSKKGLIHAQTFDWDLISKRILKLY